MSAMKLFMEKSGLTLMEASDFLDMKLKKQYPPQKDTEVDMEFIERISKEAKQWKRMRK